MRRGRPRRSSSGSSGPHVWRSSQGAAGAQWQPAVRRRRWLAHRACRTCVRRMHAARRGKRCVALPVVCCLLCVARRRLRACASQRVPLHVVRCRLPLVRSVMDHSALQRTPPRCSPVQAAPVDVAHDRQSGVSPVPVQMWQGRAQSRCRCGRGEPSPGADVAGVKQRAHFWNNTRP